jgi:hypothetical protein
VTSGPGLGNLTFFPSTVEQSSARGLLAMKISGRWSKATAGAGPEPASIVTDAQFMYISRFPSLLNHVQPKIAAPAFASDGTVKENLSPEARGQEPW